ncbi:MAG TPA: hypothetical protein VMW10_11220 [Alphaproteobacteria bacterium]|nr:hypothetical protein [Alphaproteobacteria bacterium]
MHRLDKVESRTRWRELRDLWNEFDPIGVYIDDQEWPRDEYESYCGTSMRLLEQNAATSELEAYVQSALDKMGIEGDDKKINDFVKRMQKWFQEKWSGTHL